MRTMKEVALASRTDNDASIAGLTSSVQQLKQQNSELREINRKMLAALNHALPILRDGLLPASVNYDAINAAVASVEDAIAEGERDR